MQYALRYPVVLFAFVLLALFLPHPTHAAQYTISVMDNFFAPKTLTINAGDIIVWKNNGSNVHGIVSDDGALSSGTIQPGQIFSATFGSVGSFGYHDQYYGASGGGGMSGTIAVAPASPATPVTTTSTYTVPSYPTTGGTQSVAQLQAQAQALIAQIQAIQGSLGGASTVTTTTTGTSVSPYSAACPLIGRTLKLGSSGDDVSRLQQFLAGDASVYPQALVTGYFGSLTQTAVQKWQAKYNIVSSGTPDSTGFGVVGPRTAAAIAIVCAGGSINGVSSGVQSSSPVGGFISVTPITGSAPLNVSVSATVNTTNSCSGAVYVLNFGDGSSAQQIPVPTGACGQLQQTYTHVYQYGGTYQVTLSAGSHTTSATVTISGPAAPATPTTPTSGGGNQAPAATFSSFATSGNLPFTATFYVSCVAGTAYNIAFGDGQDLGSSGVGQTSCNGGLQSVSHTYQSAGSYTAQLILFIAQANGTIGSQTWGNIGITVTNPIANYSYTPPTVQSSGTKSITIQFGLPTSCTGYDISWGDNSAHQSQNDGGTSCSQTTTATKSFSHTYASKGTYTLILKRGADLSHVDDISVTVSN